MKAAELLVKCLEAEGVKRIYGVPGEENLDVMDALLESSIRFITVHHEQAAAFAAAMEGRLTGRPGVCLSTLGPGATNMMTGVANANMDQCPIVAITGQAGEDRLHKESHQVYDLESLYRPITKWNAAVTTASVIPETVRKAFRVAAEEKPGATHLVLPEDIAAAETDAMPLARTRHRFDMQAHDDELAHAAAWLNKSQRPLILSGNGVLRQQAGEQLQRLAERLNAPILHTFMGEGAVSAYHRLNLWTAGQPDDPHVEEALHYADLIVSVGFDMAEFPPVRWNEDGGKPILHIDTTAPETDSAYPVIGGLIGRIDRNLEALADRVAANPGRERNDAFIAELRERIRSQLGDYKTDAAYPMSPQRIVSELRDATGQEDLVISDVGAHKMWLARLYPAEAPNTCLISNGYAAMGCALPGAIAAKLTDPDRRVTAVIGDGSFQMSLNDLETAVRLKLPMTILIWRDGSYGLIEQKQLKEMGRASNVTFGNPDYAMLAEAYGAAGIRIDSADELSEALATAAKTEGPVLIDCPVAYPTTKKEEVIFA